MFQAASNSPGLSRARGLCVSYSQASFKAESIGKATWFSSFNMFSPPLEGTGIWGPGSSLV